jgi:CrcB protein
MLQLLLVAAGGIIGALLRFGVSGQIQGYLNGSFPWGTLSVNLIGCFVIGALWQVSEFIIVSPNIRAFLFVGALGAFTTFSSYGLETVSLFRESEIQIALLNIIANNLLGFLMVLGGFFIMGYVVRIFE